MLRLTLRSSKDGRFLARVIDRGGFPFVLDFGDHRIIEDASQRLQHGFTMWRRGRLVSAPPQDAEMIYLLAEFYAGEGLLVFVDEPTWADRQATAEVDIPDALPEYDDRTELADIEDAVTEFAETPPSFHHVKPVPLVDYDSLLAAYDALDDEDLETELAPLPEDTDTEDPF